MTTRAERTFDVAASPERVWEFIADPHELARAISVVTDHELEDDAGTAAIWYVDLPIPLLDRAASVQTKEVERDEPHFVEFTGKSKIMNVRGRHTIEQTDDGGSTVHNQFIVDGRLPGVERFFKRNLDQEIDNLEAALNRSLEQDSA